LIEHLGTLTHKHLRVVAGAGVEFDLPATPTPTQRRRARAGAEDAQVARRDAVVWHKTPRQDMSGGSCRGTFGLVPHDREHTQYGESAASSPRSRTRCP
jgi:hypothetical protein